jgi:cytochrome c-type biogenesis protein CcmH
MSTRLLPAVAVGAALGVLVIVMVLVLRPADDASARTEALARQLRCPDCQGLSVADSPSAAAREIRRQIDDLVAHGATDDEVRAHFVARYGEWILLSPSAPLVWAVPFVVLLAGLALLGWWILRGRSGAAPPAPTPIDDDARRRVREEAEALDA